ncbi:Glycoside hydrolase family 61 protein [Coniochaeta hoffmannii]|uniref:lytic cellulose monooxygenase (C4-dehydrogenating) n=1 Tax=Coniochaeta hoffmannii TaxID=91930 RepID=A0AA38VJF7_9PEZI|nr:Glycoside hydrolase family 61 protein [Coniochaeta hoffmannii]
MKFSAAAALLAAAVADAHYTFPSVGTTADWQVVRQTKNYQSNGPVTDVQSADIRCYQMKNTAGVMNVTAGQPVSYNAKASISHPGPMAFYIAKVPAGESVATWEPGTAAVWSKIYQDMPNIAAGGMSWPTQGAKSVSVTLPKCLANGEYLLRAEHIGLHSAGSAGGAQFYISCAQISVSGGSGSFAPKNQVSFPGAYKATDPGIMINIYYPVPTSYTPPGPAVEKC